jgi:hypothetical protein
MELKIREASLAGECYDANQKIYSDPVAGFDAPVYGEDQPRGTKCLLVVIASIPGKNYYDFDQLMAIEASTIIDQNEKQYPVYPATTSMSEGGISTDLYVFVDETATSFTFALPDGSRIPIILN